MKKLFLMMLSAVVLLSTSCTRDLNEVSGTAGDEVTVTFAIATETKAQTRTPGYENATPQISDGTKADVLIWAVYNKAGEILAQYGVSEETAIAGTEKMLGYGQSGRQVSEPNDKGVVEGGFPTTVSVRLVRGQEYKIAFWAQSSKCSAYDTKDLTKVEVLYGEENGKNNDELRDAFCKVEEFTAVESGTRDVILRRPLAQINVGVAGYDYEAASKGGCRVVKSKIRIDRVARFLNVVTNSVDTSAESLQAVEFESATIPAYINMDEIPGEKYEDTDGQYAELVKAGKKYYDNEAVLRVDRNNDGEIAEYQNEDDEINYINEAIKGGANNGEYVGSPYTEEFKYLSMCYVLVPDRNDGTSTYSTTLDNVYLSFEASDDAMNPSEIHITNVPVQRNWRTNIFGEMLTANVNFNVNIDPIYSGEYNQDGDSWDEVIAEGVSYNAVTDIIYISNGEGLWWLSDMTNGLYQQPASEKLTKLILRATKAGDKWPENGFFHFPAVKIQLMSDIDLRKVPGREDQPWIPIGYHWDLGDLYNHDTKSQSYRFFSGAFDGGDHTISNITTIRPEEGVEIFKDSNVPVGLNASMGLFSTVTYGGYVHNVRVYNIDIESHYRIGAIVGCTFYSYGVDNCYVDNGTILSKPWLIGEEYDDANNVGGVVGYLDSHTPDYRWAWGIKEDQVTVNNNYVRNLTIRGYRTVGGIVGGMDAEGSPVQISNNTITSTQIIADEFQPYGTADRNEEYNWGETEYVRSHVILGGNAHHRAHVGNCPEGGTNDEEFECWDSVEHENNTISNVTMTIFNVKEFRVDESYNREGYNKFRYTEIANVPLNLFPKLAGIYSDYIHFTSSVLGTPSYKFENNSWAGIYVSNMTIDGDAVEADTANDDHVLTTLFDGITPNDDNCVVYVTGKRGVEVKNITLRGEPYAENGILVDSEIAKLTLNNVYVYDVKYTINAPDAKTSGTELSVSGSDLRGWTKYGANYNVTFTETVFETGSGTNLYAEGKLTAGSKTEFVNCIFRPGFKIDDASVEDLTFTDCYYGSDTELDPLQPLTKENYKELLK